MFLVLLPQVDENIKLVTHKQKKSDKGFKLQISRIHNTVHDKRIKNNSSLRSTRKHPSFHLIYRSHY